MTFQEIAIGTCLALTAQLLRKNQHAQLLYMGVLVVGFISAKKIKCREWRLNKEINFKTLKGLPMASPFAIFILLVRHVAGQD